MDAAQSLEALRRQLRAGFGQGTSAELPCRFERAALPKETAQHIVDTLQAEGWSVHVRGEGTQVILTFSNPPPGTLELSDAQSKQLQATLARMRRFIAGGLPGGSRSYPLVETIPFRVLNTALHLLRADGLQATLSLGSNATPKAVIFSVAPSGLDEEQFPARENS
jgi:hypothetical protein